MKYDAIIVGGGFFGLRVAVYLREVIGAVSVLVIEREAELMGRASYANQARIHMGYHYPRSVLTALRSRINFPVFREEFGLAVVDEFDHFYAIAARDSKTNSRQFVKFSNLIGAPLEPASEEVRSWFNPSMVSSVHRVREPAFDSRIIRQILLERITAVTGITIERETEASAVRSTSDGLRVETSRGARLAPRVFSTVYSNINVLNVASGVEPVNFQHEVTEMALVSLPDALKKSAFTVMDGPFFSLMPFPSRGQHTLSHVRYTPHYRWFDTEKTQNHRDPVRITDSLAKKSNYPAMRADALRFMPSLSTMSHVGSLWEAKTVLTASDADDSRPILYKKSREVPGFTTILGGKLDNVYDVLDELASDE